MNNRLIKSNDAGGGGCTNTVDLYNPFPDGGGVALYQLNGDATDVSGNYNGTASNVTYGAGEFGQAGVFNGSSSYIELDGSLANGNTGDFSISMWIKIPDSSSQYRLFATDISPFYSKLNINLETNGTLRGAFGNGINQETLIYTNSTTWANNTWQHLIYIMSWNGSSFDIKFYQNGEFDSSHNTGSTTVSVLANSKLILGGVYRQDNTTYYPNYLGSIDQVRIFNRALRPYEVEALYTEEYCTPTIVPSEHFNTVLYTGNSGAQSITSVGFAPDLTWIKERTGTDHHRLQDTVRGAGYRLYSSTTSAEGYTNDSITSFDANGFSLGSSLGVNESGQNYVAWNFKAGGAAVTNTDGTITSQVSANTEAGFSIVSYSGGNSSGTTVGHGLGKQLDMLIVKNRNDSTDQWITWHKDVERNSTSTDTFTLKGGTILTLNTTVAAGNYNYDGQMGSIGGENLIAYCFAEVEGFSNFGSYVGTGAAGNTVVTGFEPAFVMVKRSSGTGNWEMFDNKRDTENPRNKVLLANESNAEQDLTPFEPKIIDFVENGFVMQDDASALTGNTNFNISGSTYIYMAFAADPTAVEPTLEDSFNTVLYTGNGGSQNITGVGFQPDLVWQKYRSLNYQHYLIDSIRGGNKSLSSNLTNAEETLAAGITFENDGFNILGSPFDAGFTQVAWAWKGAEIPAINSNGSIPSVVSANPAAGFSIVSLTIPNANTKSVGHGLDTAPSVIIMKARDAAESWLTYHSSIGLNKYLLLNSTSGEASYTGIWSDVNSSTFTTVYHDAIGSPTRDVIAYCFAEVAGFSKFGSYVGNGSTNVITTGFEPAFVIIKAYTSADNWVMIDNKRGVDNRLYADLSNAEDTLANRITFDANGFTLTTSAYNASGFGFIYMAFANQF